MMKALIAVFFLGVFCVGTALSAPAAYTIQFTGESVMSAPLPTGSFTYDPAAGFSNFLVSWNGALIDMTSSANAPELAPDPPTGCASAGPTHQYGFLLISQAATGCTVPAQYLWGALYSSGVAQFQFILNVTDGLSVAQDQIAAISYTGEPVIDFGSGGWTITTGDAVPEPGSLTMALTGGLALLGMGLAAKRT